MQLRVRLAALFGSAVLFTAPSALAHVGINGPGFAGQTQLVTFGVGHGCEGADTVRVEVTIPKEVTSLRALPSVFGDAELKLDDTGIVTAVIWSKDKARPKDDQYYQLALRFKVPDSPFTTLYLPAKQTCRAADGKETVVDWAAIPVPGEQASGEEGPPPAPALVILPTRLAGWNKYTVKNKVVDLSVFNDAQIVWAGDAAYSGNPTTAELIKSEAGVEALTEIKAGAEIWVKY